MRVESATDIDLGKIARAVSLILEAVGEDPTRDGLRDTPDRVARMYAEVFAGLRIDPADTLSTRFEVDSDELVMVTDIPFYSMCEHHLLPFFGHAHVAYLPSGGVVAGLSKLARLVDAVAKRPQVQERLTGEIADTLSNKLNARGVLVVVDAEHLCMSMRGVRKPGSHTTTLSCRGVYSDNLQLREQVLNLIRH